MWICSGCIRVSADRFQVRRQPVHVGTHRLTQQSGQLTSGYCCEIVGDQGAALDKLPMSRDLSPIKVSPTTSRRPSS
jgi:hypothetical protein